MSNIDDLAESVSTGWPITSLLACKRCGVLLWDAEKHYADAHSFPCVVDECRHRFYRYSDLNEHSREHHYDLGLAGHYPGADDAGDFTWHKL